MMIKRSVHQKDIKIITYAANIRDPKYMKQTSTIIVGDSITPLSIKNYQTKDQ